MTVQGGGHAVRIQECGIYWGQTEQKRVCWGESPIRVRFQGNFTHLKTTTKTIGSICSFSRLERANEHSYLVL